MDSILTSVKKQFPIEETDTSFDDTLILTINSVFSILNQLGVGPSEGFAITDSSQTWNDYISGDPFVLRDVKTYMYLKVKLIFDPPSNSSVLAATERLVAEFESRINMTVDPGGAI
jgi:hypothetical protein